MKKNLSFDENRLFSHLSDCSLECFYESISALSEVWFGDREPTELTQKMQEYLMSGGLYGTLENRISVTQRAKGGKIRHLLDRIFLPYADLATQYPVLKKHKILLPICHVRRWFRVLLGGRARHSMRELRTISTVSNEKCDRALELISELGLS
jgi:hypothetical protein